MTLIGTCSFNTSIAEIQRNLQEVMNKKLSQNRQNIILEYSQLKNDNIIWSIVGRLVCGNVFQYVWQELNVMVFGKVKRGVTELCQEILETVRLKLINLKVKDSVLNLKVLKLKVLKLKVLMLKLLMLNLFDVEAFEVKQVLKMK
ncbi:hypothetical protein Tco_0952221 [Tanacetum coccineum]|uniref:Uncharacterized protein n=1 Tax=Tanacetum coccineum TaxID=301880 RepID=A0ABQ5DWD4_9ASTR